jgi:vacuolar-type H+-ATPase subunit I/STV1
MARRYYRRKQSTDTLADLISYLVVFVILGLFGWGYTHQAQLELFSVIAVMLIIAGTFAYLAFRKKRIKAALGTFSDEEILFMLKGMSPS